MLRLIPTEKLQPGMFVDLSQVSWLDHPFLRAGLLVTDEAALQKIRAVGLTQVTIDTTKGDDLADEGASRNAAETIAATTERIASDLPDVPLTFQQELITAKGIHERASEVIRGFMTEARAGQLSGFDEVGALADEMVRSITRNSSALVSLTSLKTRDDYTFMHCVSVGIFMIGLGRQLGLGSAELQLLGTAGLLHDVGKAYVPLDVLNKPSSLSDSERMTMRAHPMLGYEALINAGYNNAPVLDVVRHHHEKLDGTGYPDTLTNQDISLFSRIATVADVYDAVTSRRVYHSAMPPTAALRMIRKRAGIDFDSAVAQALIKVVGIYPIGSLVKLSSGHLAVVAEQNPQNTAKPKVLAFYSVGKEAFIPNQAIDLANSEDAIESDEDPLDWGLDTRRFWHL